MTDQAIKVGIIGTGRMGITHHSIINSHPDVTVTAVADPSTAMVALMRKYVKVNAYKDAFEMIEKEPLDAVLICSPPAQNGEIIRHAHKKSLHVFVEKPFVLTANEGRKLAKLYDDSGLVNQVGYVNRFNDVFATARTFLQEDLLGKIIRYRSEMYSGTIVRPQAESGWRGSAASGGGVVYEMASHAVDLSNFLFGTPDKIVGSSTSAVFSKTVEDIVSSTFVYKSGVTGSIYVNWSDASYRKPTNKFEIFGLNGKILADQHGMKIYLNDDHPVRGFKKGWNNIYITDVFSSVPFYVRGIEFTAQLYEFVEKIKSTTDRRTRCSFADGASALEVMEAMIQDAANIKKDLVS